MNHPAQKQGVTQDDYISSIPPRVRNEPDFHLLRWGKNPTRRTDEILLDLTLNRNALSYLKIRMIFIPCRAETALGRPRSGAKTPQGRPIEISLLPSSTRIVFNL